MVWLSVLFVLWAVQILACVVDNTGLFYRIPTVGPGRRKWPLVSVCIPARNEEKRLGPCLESLLKQDYPRYEVLVLDDQSTDGTAALVRGRLEKNGPLKLLKGKVLPAGWLGKPWACHQISQKARGRWLLFTDADTWHSPDMLKRSVASAEERQADLVSYVTRQETVTWMEALVVPVMVFFLISFLPVRAALKPGGRLSKFAGAGGQFLLFRRSAYRAIGGHQGVKDQILEDLKIGNRVVQAGLKLSLADGTELVACRMYHSAREVIEGFSKNFFPLYGFRMSFMAWNCLFMVMATMVPYLVPFLARPAEPVFWAALGLALTQTAVRLFQAVRYRMPVLSALFHPVGCLLFMLIGFNSVRWYLFLKRGYWKGRILRPRQNAY